ncbi:hypothetical protein VTK73DRAFT_3397 [Phialemonium thermophilum]|uniref:Uncharacterized protein n=1 Tax=Phialemonium thermophilum TaxID=223376 RepID=A0ABR3VIK0_9PEZI
MKMGTKSERRRARRDAFTDLGGVYVSDPGCGYLPFVFPCFIDPASGSPSRYLVSDLHFLPDAPFLLPCLSLHSSFPGCFFPSQEWTRKRVPPHRKTPVREEGHDGRGSPRWQRKPTIWAGRKGTGRMYPSCGVTTHHASMPVYVTTRPSQQESGCLEPDSLPVPELLTHLHSRHRSQPVSLRFPPSRPFESGHRLPFPFVLLPHNPAAQPAHGFPFPRIPCFHGVRDERRTPSSPPLGSSVQRGLDSLVALLWPVGRDDDGLVPGVGSLCSMTERRS